MRITFDKGTKQANFKCGDFFKTKHGSVRQIVKSGSQKYVVVDPQDGDCVSFLTQNNEFSSPQEAAEAYVKEHSNITKLKCLELIVTETTEVLERERL